MDKNRNIEKIKHLPRGKIITDTFDRDFCQEELISKIKELEMENAIFKETIKILKKGQGIDALRGKHSLSSL